MGIIVPEATLPSNIKVSNVYISFTGETIYTLKTEPGVYKINSFYRVYSDANKSIDNPIKYPINVTVSDVTPGVYSIIYKELKSIYPGSIDIDGGQYIDPTVEPEVPKRTCEETDFGSNVLARAELYLSQNPGAYELQNVYNIAEQNFYSGGLASTNEMLQILQLLDGNVTSSG